MPYVSVTVIKWTEQLFLEMGISQSQLQDAQLRAQRHQKTPDLQIRGYVSSEQISRLPQVSLVAEGWFFLFNICHSLDA